MRDDGSRGWRAAVPALALLAAAGCASSSATPPAERTTTTPSSGPAAPTSRGPAKRLQLRKVVNAVKGPCTAWTRGDGAGPACGVPGTSGYGYSYQLGPSLGDVTVASATVTTQVGDVSTAQAVVLVRLDKAGSLTLASVSRSAVGKQLAILLNLAVVGAPVIQQEIADGQLLIVAVPATEQAAQRLAADLAP